MEEYLKGYDSLLVWGVARGCHRKIPRPSLPYRFLFSFFPVFLHQGYRIYQEGTTGFGRGYCHGDDALFPFVYIVFRLSSRLQLSEPLWLINCIV